MLTTASMRSGKRLEAESRRDYGASIASQWRELFASHKEALSSVARILTEGPCSPAVVLFNAEAKIKDMYVTADFRFKYAIRSVVLAALVMPSLEDCPDGFELFDCRSADLVEFESHMALLPRPERGAVFLRDVLGYSKREAGLLLGIGDSRVEDLLYSGRTQLLSQGQVAFERVKRYFDAGRTFSDETPFRSISLPTSARIAGAESGSCKPGRAR